MDAGAIQRAIDALAATKPVTGVDWQHDDADIVMAIGCLTRILYRRREKKPRGGYTHGIRDITAGENGNLRSETC